MYGVVDVPEKGVGLVCRRSAPAGTSLVVEQPYEATLNNEWATSRSDWTFRESPKLQRCAGCKFAWYADRNEQKVAWQNGHKAECQALQNCGEFRPGPSVRLMARILWKRMRQKDSPSFEGVARLMTHWDDLTDMQKVTYSQAAHVTIQYMGIEPDAENQSLPSVKEVAQLFAGLACNSHTICDDEERPIGLGLYCSGALVNHSCSPSAVQVFLGKTVHFRALHTLSKDEEITIAYLELGQTRQERRDALLSRYHFDINQGDSRKANLAPLAQMEMPDPALPAVHRVWQQCPHMMDKADHQLYSLVNDAGDAFGDTGFCITADNQEARLLGEDAFPMDPEHQVAEDNPSTSGSEQLPARANTLLFDFWGSAFVEGSSQINWAMVNKLASMGMAWHRVCEQANAAYRGGTSFALSHLESQLLQFSDTKEDKTPKGMLVTPGPCHVLRARLLEVKYRIAQQTAEWGKALQYGLELRPFYNLVYPKAFPLRGLHEASLAKIANLTRDSSEAIRSARNAIAILRIARPESPCLDDMRQIERDNL